MTDFFLLDGTGTLHQFSSCLEPMKNYLCIMLETKHSREQSQLTKQIPEKTTMTWYNFISSQVFVVVLLQSFWFIQLHPLLQANYTTLFRYFSKYTTPRIPSFNRKQLVMIGPPGIGCYVVIRKNGVVTVLYYHVGKSWCSSFLYQSNYARAPDLQISNFKHARMNSVYGKSVCVHPTIQQNGACGGIVQQTASGSGCSSTK